MGKIALVVPGGVDRSGEFRVIPALLALIERLSARHVVHVYALRQEPQPASWSLAGAQIHNIGGRGIRLRTLRAIYSEHRSSPFELVQSVWSGTCGFVTVATAALLRIPSLVHVAGGEPVALPDIGYGGQLTLRGRIQERVVLRAASVITAASAPMIEAIARLGFKAQRLPLGVDLSVWPARPPQRRDTRAPARLIHVASLNRVKDQTTLLQALAGLARQDVPFEMDVVGEDTLGGQMQSLARELGLGDRVRFRGFLPQRQLRPIVETAHLMIISSRHEAGPLAVLEAAAVGVPSIGTAVGHLSEWAPTAAVAVPVGDCTALTAAIQSVLADEEQRLRLGGEAHARAIREDAEHTARCFLTLYAELAGACHRPAHERH